MSKWYSIRYMASLIWIGLLLGISFMEAPLKFQAPSVTLPIGLEIGRLVFNTLNKMEWIMLLLMILSLIFSHPKKGIILLVAGLGLILIYQTTFLLPRLDQRAEVIISGGSPASDNIHFFYVALEVVKLVLLATSTYYFIYKNDDDYENAR